MDPVTHKILHGIVGAGSAAIAGNDPLSGATGAIVGEIAGSIYRMGAMGELTPGTDAWDRAANLGSGIAQMVAAVSAMGLGLDADTASRAAGTAAENNALVIGIPSAIAAIVEVAATTEGAIALTAGVGATGLALQHGIKSMQGGTNAPGYDPYNDGPTSSSSTPAERSSGDNPSARSVLFQASPASSSSSSSSSGPSFYESLYHLPSTLGMTPAPSLPTPPGFTPHRSGPSVYSTPIHRPDLRPLITPRYDGPHGLTVSTPRYDGPHGLTVSTPRYDGPHGLTVSTPRYDGPNGLSVFRNDSVSGTEPMAPPRIHKNSNKYVGDTHVYVIRRADGTIEKIGESAQGLRQSDGASKRAEQQARRLQRKTGERFRTQIRRTFKSKQEARSYETKLIDRYRRMFGKDKLPGNKTNR